MALTATRNALETAVDKTLTDEQKMVRRLLGYISLSDKHEQDRRKTDRIGGNLKHSKHWNVQVSDRRAAITANVAAAIIDQKISIMLKQQPVPVVENNDVGDEEGSKLMRSCVKQWWENYNLQADLEQTMNLACCTRSASMKAIWDSTLYGGAGDVAVDIIPGWRRIVDPMARAQCKGQFSGDRAMLPRSRAMVLYPKAAKKIKEAPAVANQGPSANASGQGTPIRDAWAKLSFDFPTTAIVNGSPTLLSYTGNSPSVNATADLVQICEMYIKDYTMVKVPRKKKDKYGQAVQRPVLGDDGIPKFNVAGHSQHTADDGTPFTIPMYELVLEDVMEDAWERLYPDWRRVTLLLPDATIIDDCAWDYYLPYADFHDGESLEGYWVKGSLLELETLQGALNVSISTMLDNLRFSAFRAYIAYTGSMIEKNNLNISPGEVLRAGEKGTFEPLPVEQISSAWFQWIEFVISLMEKIIGATGIMQGEAAGRVDSAAGYDMLAEIGGSRLVKITQIMERSIGDLLQIVGQYMQKHYDERHAVRVEDVSGNITSERITPGALQGSFNYRVLTGSSLAWSESAVRARILEEFQLKLRDIVSVWKALKIEDWPSIMARMVQLPPQLQGPAPPRTRANSSKPPGQARGRNGQMKQAVG